MLERLAMASKPLVLTCIFAFVLEATSQDAGILEICCRQGDKWGLNYGPQDCANLPPPKGGVASPDLALCQEIMQVCCLKRYRNDLCQRGKALAKEGRTKCETISRASPEILKDCCKGCQIGLSLAAKGEDCESLDVDLACPWGAPARECCYQNPSANQFSPLEPAQNRCNSNPQPCPQSCQDPGVLSGPVKCSCFPGYVLAQDRKNCIDVDECAEGKDTCDQNQESCLNSPGGFHCIENDQPGSPSHNIPPRPAFPPYPGGADVPPHVIPPRPPLPPYPGNVDGPSDTRCPSGYVFNGTFKVCDDLNECAQSRNPCDIFSEKCVNTVGSFTCQPLITINGMAPQPEPECLQGFKHEVGHGCIDVDECEDSLDNCDFSAEYCLNVFGSFQCQLKTSKTCPAGYKFQDGTCKDVDECTENLHDCDLTNERCFNNQGSYSCRPDPANANRCRNGFIHDHVTGGCRDIDECQISPCPAGAKCVNLYGSYRCDALSPGPLRNDTTSDLCRRGYEWNRNSRSCVDINECWNAAAACPNSQCENTVGSFRCGCTKGLTLDPISKTCVDLNECQLGLHNCVPTQRCDNTLGSFVCVRITSCGTGYTVNAQTGVCEDDDECRIRSEPCGQDYVCRNTLGSFRCDRASCGSGQRLQPDGSCHQKECPAGTKVSPLGNCADIDECATGTARCRNNQRCINSYGSYTCQSLLVCGGGYQPDQQGTQCLDVDECADGSHECAKGQICRNRPGGYSCECPAGFSLNSKRECEDIDECSRFAGQVCSISSVCQNTIGSYLCDCKAGFTKLPGSQTCTDIDECHDNPNLCQHNCINIWGGFQCTCRPGFTVGSDNRSCVDVDECSLYKGKGNLCIGFCVNEPGSFSCSCPDGYRLGGDIRTCNDINECQEQGVCSGEEQVCLNTRGGYKCTNISCPPNYIRDREHRNRCKRVVQDCSRGDSACLVQPISISFNFLTFVSNMKLPPSGQLDLFTMRGPRFSITNVEFELLLRDARSPMGVEAAVRENFHLRRMAYNEAMISLVKSLQGPQDIELELKMKMYHNGLFGGSAVARLNIVVSRYEF